MALANAARYVVGIDLGTTHTVVAYAARDGGETQLLAMPQLVSATEAEARTLLPSFLYAPPSEEGERLPIGALFEPPWIVGSYARTRAAEAPDRAVASAKSWLCHAGVDRHAAILPWRSRGTTEDGADAPALSPVEASTRILRHVVRCWNAAFADAPLDAQDVVLTVPASFDEASRTLTLEAARAAGLEPRLLEEPQAAFYDWMSRVGKDGLRVLVSGGDSSARVLVCDIGGGTSDFSLLRLATRGEAIRVERIAVGDHLLLGGDNMDLALAQRTEPRLAGHSSDGTPPALDAIRFGQLVASCRDAKERLLAAQGPSEATVAVFGTGAKLIGGARSTALARTEAEDVVLEGFFPHVPVDARPGGVRSGLVAFGLPYARDTAITRHLAAFLARHPGESGDAIAPRWLLLNGGVFRAERIAARLADVLGRWRGSEDAVRVLPHADPDVAVARGAVAYALALVGRGPKIGGGSARAYFVGVGAGKGVCVVPQGAEPSVTHRTTTPLALTVGRAARFDLYASRTHRSERAGDVVTLDDEAFHRLPPVTTTLPGDAASNNALRVVVEGELSEVGTLELACAEIAPPGRRFTLAFEVRAATSPVPSPPPSSRQAPVHGRLEEARSLIDKAFGAKGSAADGRDAKDLVRNLERPLGERTTWATGTARALVDTLLDKASMRKRSADHERIVWLLTGFCLRPGFGASGDDARIARLAPLFLEPLAHAGEARVWQQLWIAARRVAGGLPEATQVAIRDLADPAFAPSSAKKKRKGQQALAPDDALAAASWLERVPHARRAELGAWLLERTFVRRDPRLWEALGRIGARVPAYASAHYVLAPRVVEEWVDHLLREPWPEIPIAPTIAAQLCRRTGDRARDVSERLRESVLRKMAAARASEADIRRVREVVEVDAHERSLSFGEELPPGLRLVSD